MESGEDNNVRLRKMVKEKWHEHYQKKDEIFAPSLERAQMCGVVFYWYLAISMGIVTCTVTVPFVLGDYEYAYVNKLIICFFMVVSMVNWLQTWRYQPVCEYKENNTGSEITDENKALNGWKMCLACQHYAPPRAHHCKLCKCCILKRDHHCFFTASCIGFYNQRYFIIFLLYSTAGLAYAGYYLLHYNNMKFPFLSWEVLKYFPLVNMYLWITGYVTIFDLYMMWQLFCCLVAGTGSVGFFIWEIFLVINGQTTHESVKGDKTYSVGSLNQRFLNVFGAYWMINFVWPIPFYPKGKGLSYEKKDNK